MLIMKHLKEGLIKQRGIRFNQYSEIQNPTVMDIQKEGNVVIIDNDGKIRPYIVLSKYKYIDRFEFIFVGYNPKYPGRWDYWVGTCFVNKFPQYSGEYGDLNVRIIKVFDANINRETLKTSKDIKRVLEPFNEYCK